MEKFNDINYYIEKYGQKLIDFLPDLILAVLMLFIGLWIIRVISRLINKFFQRKDYDVTLEKFIASLINWSLKIILFVLVITQLGVESASLIAIIGAAGLAIGLALQGSLSNFAGGVLILLLRPFKVGDFIKAQGVEGTVKEISIFNTKLLTFGNQEAILPNGKLSNETIINFTTEGIRKENIIFGISYDSSVETAKNILLELAMEQEIIMKVENKMPMIVMAELADSSVNLSLRYWATNENFWNARWFTLEEGKKRLEAAGISIPFPQRDVHFYTNNNK
ncbi:mechanosensitive ion channel protein [Patiriisocius marinistellae]|uniref:Mechanosensitive ion channel protein n=1 Tax=Patiriisocius marinistellae TaxID=2494560 RepID=A0A5J4FRT0_9FLAO|nr:mechanosensitive ion channel domain-containing protein [Patiriisocius marinistellae]GEQ84497.1 mechanosensitive ion channel protein [Patiriisocius marinistellae]